MNDLLFSELVLDQFKSLPHQNMFKTFFIFWCLAPGPLNGTDIIFYQVCLLIFKNLTWLSVNLLDIPFIQVGPWEHPWYSIFSKIYLSIKIFGKWCYLQITFNSTIIADMVSAIFTILDFILSLESPGNTFILACGCVYLIQISLKLFSPHRRNSDISFKV